MACCSSSKIASVPRHTSQQINAHSPVPDSAPGVMAYRIDDRLRCRSPATFLEHWLVGRWNDRPNARRNELGSGLRRPACRTLFYGRSRHVNDSGIAWPRSSNGDPRRQCCVGRSRGPWSWMGLRIVPHLGAVASRSRCEFALECVRERICAAVSDLLGNHFDGVLRI